MATQEISKFFNESFGVRRAPRVIDFYLAELLRQVRGNPVVILTAGTSVGKTSRVPQALALANPGTHVWVSQPRRKAVRKNGAWVAREMGSQPGQQVGWFLAGGDGERRESSATQIHFRVDQSLLNQVISTGRLPEGYLVIDEAHERSVPIDMLLGVIKGALPQSPQTKIVITSATIDARKFSEFFDGAPVIEVPGKGFPIHEEVIRLGKGEHHTQGAGRAACMVLDKFLLGEGLVPAPDKMDIVPITKGTVLVLLPGKEDIRDVMSRVQWYAKSKDAENRVEILECHGDTESAADDLIDQPLKDKVLRFVCATEVVRTSVTIADIVGVVDSLQVKRPLANAMGVVHLDKITISRAEAEQGKGRGGRERPAFYMPISFEREYESLQPHPRPAVLYSPIESVALTIAAIGKSIRTFPLLDRPETNRVDVAIKRLHRLGLMDGKEGITVLGREVERFSVDVASAVSFYMADRLGVLPETLIAAAIRENEEIFWLPRRDQELVATEELLRLVLRNCQKEAYGDWRVCEPKEGTAYDPANLPEWVTRNPEGELVINCGHHHFPRSYNGESGARLVASLVRKHWAGPERSDFAAGVRAFRAYKAGDPIARQFLNGRRVQMVYHTIGLLLEDLGSSSLRINGGLYEDRPFDGSAVTKALLTGLIDNVLVKKERMFDGPLGQTQLARTSACPDGMSVVLVGGIRKIVPPKGREFYISDMAAPVDPNWIAELMPHLCVFRRRGDHHYNRVKDCVMETQNVTFVDLGLTRQVSSEDAEGIAMGLARGVGESLYQEFREVMNHNSQVQKMAHDFYCRSGGQTRQFTENEEIRHYSTVFFDQGIRSYADWQKAAEEGRVSQDDLMLRFEDYVTQAEQERILRENPDTIEVLGVHRQVTYEVYQKPVQPLVSITHEEVYSHAWLNLPDEGLRLPGGRLVEVVTLYGRNSNIPQFKRAMMESFRKGVFENWHNRPNPAVPNMAGEVPTLELMVVECGKCPITGEPVFAYGAFQYSSLQGGFVWKWHPPTGEEIAKAEHAKGVAKFMEAQKASLEQQALKVAQILVAEIKGRWQEVISQEGFDQLPAEMRQKVEASMRRNLYNVSLAEVESSNESAERLRQEVMAALAEFARKRVSGKVRQDVVVPISTESRTTTQAWAIDPDGMLIEPIEKQTTDGRHARTYGYRYGDLPLDALVISHSFDNYGYRLTEKWQIHCLPPSVSNSQRESAVRLVSETRNYFQGREACWDFSKEGEVVVSTCYSRDFLGEEMEAYNAMCGTLPIQMLACKVAKVQGDTGAYLEVSPGRQAQMQASANSPAPVEIVEEPPVVPGDGTFMEVGSRHFRCGCGANIRATSGQYGQYQKGAVLEITCTNCGVRGKIKK